MKHYSQIIVLAEDTMHTSFVRGFLKAGGAALYCIRERVRRVYAQQPVTGATGNAWVQKQFPEELKAIRQRISRKRAATFLVVVYDSDIKSVSSSREIFGELGSTGDDSCYALVIPKRNIESWIRFFQAGEIDEQTDFAHSFDNRLSRRAGKNLYELMTSSSAQGLNCIPPSLAAAADELRKMF